MVHQLRWLASRRRHRRRVLHRVPRPHDPRRARRRATTSAATVRFVDEGARAARHRRRGAVRGRRGAARRRLLRPVRGLVPPDRPASRGRATSSERRRSAHDRVPQRRRLGREQRRSSTGTTVVRYDKDEPDPAAAGMHYIDYGLSILRRETRCALEFRSGRPSDLADMFRTLSLEGRLAGYEAQHRFFEIGSPAGLADLQQPLRSRRDDDRSPLIPRSRSSSPTTTSPTRSCRSSSRRSTRS